MSATPWEVEAVIAREKSKQSSHAPRGVCTPSLPQATSRARGEEACKAAAQLTEAKAVTWIEEPKSTL
jgi:hypothetical protein